MKIKTKGELTPKIKSIKYIHNVISDEMPSSYLLVEFDDKKYRPKILDVNNKFDYGLVDNSYTLKETENTDIVTIYDIQEEGFELNEK